jgi:hypothetical protein
MGERRASLRRAWGTRDRAPALAVLLLAVLPLLVASPAGAETVRIASGESAVPRLEKRAEEIEAKLAQKPDDESLIASLTRTRINVANAMITEGAGKSPAGVAEVRQQLAFAAVAWSKYLKVTRKPSPGLAIVVAPGLFELAELSTSSQEAFKNVKAAAAAQKIAAEGRPGKGSWSTLAFYDLFAQTYKAAEQALEKAIAYTHAKVERESLEKMFKEIEKKAKHFGKGLERRWPNPTESAARGGTASAWN